MPPFWIRRQFSAQACAGLDEPYRWRVFFGERRSSIDLYLTVMTWWRPGKAWIEENCPKLGKIARSAEALPGVGEEMHRNMA